MQAANAAAANVASLLTPAERLAFRPVERILPSHWAERHRELTRRQSSRPGPWQNANAPALVGLMDLCVRRSVRELWVIKAAQVGASEAVRNVIGYIAAVEAEPLLLVLPNEQAGRKMIRKRIIPLFEDTACLAELSTGSTRDKKLTSILLANGFQLELGWSGSPQSLASDPIRYVVLDEVDKYEQFAGREASPVDLARVRTRTYADRSLIVATSTPTTRLGPIHQGYEACTVKLHFFAPCPHCRVQQRLIFDRLEWEKFKDVTDDDARADRIRTRKAAWYRCAAPTCQKRIDEHHRRASLWAGFWGTPDGGFRLYCDGHETGAFPEGTKVGLQIHGLHDLSASFADMAAEIVAAGKDPAKIMHLRNSTQAEVFEQQVATPTVSVFAAKCRPDPDRCFTPPPAKIIPRWASRLLMTVDTQKDHFWYVIRAYGFGRRSQRIDHGRVSTFDALRDLADRAYFPYEEQAYPPTRVWKLGIDSGGGKVDLDRSRTDEVYRFCLTDPLRYLPIKGTRRSDQPIRLHKVLYTPFRQGRNPYEVWLYLLDVGYYQDLLQSDVMGMTPQIDKETGEVLQQDQWLLNNVDDPEYNRHLANMHKIRVSAKGKSRVGAKGLEEMWAPKTAGARVDYRDCEVYQVAMAHGPGQCLLLPSEEQMVEQLRAADRASKVAPSGITTPDGRPFLATQR